MELEAESQAMSHKPRNTRGDQKTPSGWESRELSPPHDLRRIQPASTSTLNFWPPG